MIKEYTLPCSWVEKLLLSLYDIGNSGPNFGAGKRKEDWVWQLPGTLLAGTPGQHRKEASVQFRRRSQTRRRHAKRKSLDMPLCVGIRLPRLLSRKAATGRVRRGTSRAGPRRPPRSPKARPPSIAGAQLKDERIFGSSFPPRLFFSRPFSAVPQVMRSGP